MTRKTKRAAAQVKVEEFKVAGAEKWDGFKELKL